MTSQPRTGARLAVVLVTAMIATLTSQLPASAATYTITISTAATSGVSGSGNPTTYTPAGPGAVLNVAELVSALSGGAVVVGSPGTTSSVELHADITSAGANDLTFAVPATLGADVNISLGTGKLTFASSLDGAHTFGVAGSGDLDIAGPVGGVTPLSSLSAHASTISVGGLAVAGGVSLTSADAPVTQTGGWTVGGTTLVDAGTGTITLTSAGNDFAGPVSLTGGPTQVTDRTALTLDAIDVATFEGVSGETLLVNGNLVMRGDLVLRTSGHSIAQVAGMLLVGGASDLDAGTGAITLTSGGNEFVGPVSLTGGTTRVNDQNALTLGRLAVGSLTAVSNGALWAGEGTVTGNLELTSNHGAIGEAVGGLQVGGSSTIDAGAGPISLDDAANDFVGTVSLTGGTTQVTGARALVLGTAQVTALNGLAGGTLSVLPGAVLQATGAMVLASDRAASGTGLLKLGDAASLTAGGPIALYAANQDRVDLGTGVTINGALYEPGAAYVNTDREQWGVAYPSGTAVSPFTFFFEDLGPQTLTFTSTPSPAVVGGSYTPVATSTAALPVSLTIAPGSIATCSIDGSGTVRFLAPGTCLIDADQPGDTTHAPAAQAQQSVVVAPPSSPTAPPFPGPVTGVDTASSSDPEGSATARQGCATGTGHGVGRITVAAYADNPVGAADFRTAGPWFDVQVPAGSAFTSVDLSCAPGATATPPNTLYWWDGTQWRVVTGQRHDAASGLTSVTLTGSSSPSLAELTGTVFAMGTRPLVSRLAGADRVQTAIEVSRAACRDGSAGAVVLAADDAYADALVGGPLAVAERGPLLLTAPGRVPTAVKDELRRVLPGGGTVYLLGGDAALSSRVERQVDALGLVVRRLGGATRYDTAVRVARRLPDPQRVFLATGTDFPDALSAGAAAAHTDGVVLLTAGTSVPAATQRWLARHPDLPRTAIGGPAANAVPEATRLAGPDRYATASLVAEQLFGDPATVGVASGEAFADALSVVTLLSPLHAPLLLTRPGRLPAPTSDWLGRHRATLVDVTVVGGTSAVTSSVQERIVAAVGGTG